MGCLQAKIVLLSAYELRQKYCYRGRGGKWG